MRIQFNGANCILLPILKMCEIVRYTHVFRGLPALMFLNFSLRGVEK